MKRLLFSLAAVLVSACALRADTSYLLIQGPFGDGGLVETYQWKVLYEHGSLTTGLDLMSAVFGTPSDSGTTYLGKELYTSGNSTLGASYLDYGSGGSFLFTASLTIDSHTVAGASDPSWNYHLAGGSGYEEIPYSTGVWTSANDGLNSRILSDGSFDAWVFGSYPAPVEGSGPGVNDPTVGNFASATVVNVVPEPGSAALLLIGATGLFFRRRRL